MTPERQAGLLALAERLGHRFRDLGLLDRALTHSSHAHEQLLPGRHNEPLEFLGDAVLGFLVADMLHARDPEAEEGAKTKTRAHLVSAPGLARHAAELGLPDLIRLGRGEEKTGGRRKRTLWSDAFEAVVAAVYLDGGLDAARAVVERRFAQDLAAGPRLPLRDFKSSLQELLQGRGRPLPVYEVVAELGPDHRRLYRVRCLVEGRPVAQGEGHSKKEAQQEAARRALEELTAELA